MRTAPFVFALLLAFAGCGKHSTHASHEASVGDVNHSAPPLGPPDTNPDTNDKAPPAPAYRILTNDEIIAETHKCEAAGLDGEVWGMFDEKDNPQGTTEIRCTPRKHTDNSK